MASHIAVSWGWLKHSCDHGDKGCFASTIGSKQTKDLFILDDEIHTFDSFLAIVVYFSKIGGNKRIVIKSNNITNFSSLLLSTFIIVLLYFVRQLYSC